MAQNYIIATASTADLTREYLDEHQIPFISYLYELDGEEFQDDCREETRLDVYHRMREGSLPSTSAINVYGYYAFFEPLVKEGKDIVFLDMSHEMSSSWRFCDEAIAQLKEAYPDVTIYNVDTRCISGGLGLLVEKAMERYEAGMGLEDLLAWIEANKLKIAHRFTVDSLEWLARGGRLSNISAFAGTVLSIKPVMYVPDEGTLVADQKVRGRTKALKKVVELIVRDNPDPEGLVFRINHADCYEDAAKVKEMLLEAFPTLEDGDITITGLGVVIGAHCGPGLFTIFYMADKRLA